MSIVSLSTSALHIFPNLLLILPFYWKCSVKVTNDLYVFKFCGQHFVFSLLVLSAAFNIYLFIYLFGCVGSSWWHVGSFVAVHGLFVAACGLLSSCGAWDPERVGSVVVACRLSCPAACGTLVPWPGIKPASPALEGGFLTIGPPGKSPQQLLIQPSTLLFETVFLIFSITAAFWFCIIIYTVTVLSILCLAQITPLNLCSWALNSAGLNCMGPLTCGFFSLVNTVVLCDLWLVESTDVEPQILRNCIYGGPTINYTQIFQLCRGSAPLTPYCSRVNCIFNCFLTSLLDDLVGVCRRHYWEVS